MSEAECPPDSGPDGVLGPDPELYDEGQPEHSHRRHGQRFK
jgi:hypothetical protein